MTREATPSAPLIYALTDGRRGYFYCARFTGTPWFQPVDKDNQPKGDPELANADDHEVEERI